MKNEIMIKGGLGNQLFQYAFAVSVKKTNGFNIVVNRYYYLKAKDNRKLSLTNLSIPNLKVRSRFSSFFNGSLYRLKRKMLFIKNKKSTDYSFFYRHGMILNYDYGFFPIKSNVNRNLYIDGHFQSSKYFDEFKDEIKSMFSYSGERTEINKKTISDITDSSVCVHIRRGDFLDAKNSIFNVCDEKYYENAINVMKTKIKNPKFFIFSNSSEDLHWIKENYSFTENMVFVDNNNSDVEELDVMSHFSNFIMSNSTFSWWAQYLANSKFVIAPSRWLNNDEDWKELYSPNWIIVNV